MLHPIEIVPTARRTARRAVRIGCEIVSDRGASLERIVDLSPRGACVEITEPLARGEELVLGFVPPGWQDRVETLARVTYVWSAGATSLAGVTFVDLDPTVRERLTRTLRGLPPPLPVRKRAMVELVWLDVLVTWEEDLGDRVNSFEVSDVMSALDDGELAIETLSPLLTAGRSDYAWQHA